MYKTLFRIAKMDCPSEEQMIRMKLAHLPIIKAMEFDISGRLLTVYHTESYHSILQILDTLNWDTTLSESQIIDNLPKNIQNESQERRLLWQVLIINFLFFGIESIAGLFSKSMGLMADRLDMLADSLIYGLALFAIGSSIAKKNNIAQIAGYMQLMLAIFGFIETMRHFLGNENLPTVYTMFIVSLLALMGNALCLYLLQKTKSKEAHIQASMIFTSSDVLVNLGVILAAVLVKWSASKYPDLLVGAIVFFMVGQGAFKILKLSKNS